MPKLSNVNSISLDINKINTVENQEDNTKTEKEEIVHQNNIKPFCLNCGTTNQENFYTSCNKSHSVTGKIPYCKSCCKLFYEQYIQQYGDLLLALYYLCRKLDIPFLYNNCNTIKKNGENNTTQENIKDLYLYILPQYIKSLNFAEKNNWGTTFDESKDVESLSEVVTLESIVSLKRRKNLQNVHSEQDYDIIEYDVVELQIKWGNFDNDDLALLENEYLDWAEKLGDYIYEKSTELMVKQVCLQLLDVTRKRERGEKVKDDVLVLQSLMKESGLIDKQQKSSSQDLKIGMTIRDIEQLRPLKPVDKSLEDVDNYRDLIDTFIGAMSRTLGKENYFTERFDEIYKDYNIDIVNGGKKNARKSKQNKNKKT